LNVFSVYFCNKFEIFWKIKNFKKTDLHGFNNGVNLGVNNGLTDGINNGVNIGINNGVSNVVRIA